MKDSLPTIGFIGLGVMGKSMAEHLINKNYQVNLFTRTKAKAETLLTQGGKWHNNVASLSSNSDIIITIVGFPEDVEEIYLGIDGILDHANENTIVIDMTTSEPSLAKKIHTEALKKNIHSLDAPISGGDLGAKNATLSIMVGGDKETFKKALPVLEVMGKNIVLQGPAGSGQHTKMCNQIAIASNMLGVCEALAYANKNGLDANTVLKSISEGAAGSWSLSNLVPRMINNDFDPGFYIKHFIKDMKIAVKEAKAAGLDCTGLELSLKQYQELQDSGKGDLGTQALYQYYQ